MTTHHAIDFVVLVHGAPGTVYRQPITILFTPHPGLTLGPRERGDVDADFIFDQLSYDPKLGTWAAATRRLFNLREETPEEFHEYMTGAGFTEDPE